MAGDKPNCGRHECKISAGQLGKSPTVYKRHGQLHVWAGEPDDLYCLIHSDPSYQALGQLGGDEPSHCLDRMLGWRDDDNQLHRDDGPAEIWPDGTKQWYQHGKHHRDGGPAVIRWDGTQEWYQHGEYHRDDGPAVIEPDGTQLWYQDGKLHRDNGPAAIYEDGDWEWYQHGKRVTREQCIKP